ncbi:phosphatidate cytidylyltransferase [Striga asiatica]|uniref:Phosphatidate cytidylyltransferase n=1 Tax=Striga asiatica TaxID=4170 RepID=A0A5A7QZL4_STRAF|nr:phosphatidate cytidylyltransferase [Striga asiatica]
MKSSTDPRVEGKKKVIFFSRIWEKERMCSKYKPSTIFPKGTSCSHKSAVNRNRKTSSRFGRDSGVDNPPIFHFKIENWSTSSRQCYLSVKARERCDCGQSLYKLVSKFIKYHMVTCYLSVKARERCDCGPSFMWFILTLNKMY